MVVSWTPAPSSLSLLVRLFQLFAVFIGPSMTGPAVFIGPSMTGPRYFFFSGYLLRVVNTKLFGKESSLSNNI